MFSPAWENSCDPSQKSVSKTEGFSFMIEHTESGKRIPTCLIPWYYFKGSLVAY